MLEMENYLRVHDERKEEIIRSLRFQVDFAKRDMRKVKSQKVQEVTVGYSPFTQITLRRALTWRIYSLIAFRRLRRTS